MTTTEAGNQVTTQKLQTHISAVTVYPAQALVVRRGSVNLAQGEHCLVLEGLPNNLKADSVRAVGQRSSSVRLLEVKTQSSYGTETVAEQSARLKQQIQQLEAQIRTTQDAATALQMQRKFVETLGEKYLERFLRVQPPQALNLDEIRDLLSFVGPQYVGYSDTISQNQEQTRTLSEQIASLREQLRQVTVSSFARSWTVGVLVAATEATAFELEVSYLVTGASWTPLYDVYAQTESDRLQLTYLAEVRQQTGEDWDQVQLRLSTSKPSLGLLPAKLGPWYFDLRPKDAASSAAISPTARSRAWHDPQIIQTPPAQGSNEMGASDDPFVPIQDVAASVSRAGGIVTFQVERNSSIPSDGSPHKVTIFSEDYPCHTKYVAVPRLSNFAYLEATVLNPTTGILLLSGKVNVFRHNTLVGTTELDNVAPGQEFKLNIGIDEGMKIEREFVEREVEQIGNYSRTTYGYRLRITNFRDEPTTLRLIEQIPVSLHEHAKVRLIRIDPQTQFREMGLLGWMLTVQPGARQQLEYQFTVEYPDEQTVYGMEALLN